MFKCLNSSSTAKITVSRPTSFGDVFTLAQITEARLEDQTTPATGTITKPVTSLGTQKPDVPRLRGPSTLGDVHVLIDNGSTHNFIRPDVVEKMCLPIKSTKAFKVYIGSGESLLCESVCSSVTLHMQGVVMEVDLYVLPMQGPNVVLGIQWLQNLGKVTHDYAHQTMKFTLLDNTYSLKGDDSLPMKKINLHQMQAMLEHDDVYGVYEVHHLSIETKVEEMRPETTGPCLAELELLLLRFDSLFQVPTALPPHRSIDHRIHLLPETKSVNVRPYRYPHYQKEEMEKLVNEMRSQGIIYFSQSPFSSPDLLVKKKGRSYHFCMDYLALNAVTVKDKFPIPKADEMFDELGGAVKKTKCVFGAETLEYLGHMISGCGVEMDPKKGGQEAVAFQELKQQLSTTPILSLPDFTQELVVEAGASDYGIGAYKPGVANQVADALSRMCEDGELVKAEFKLLTQPILGYTSQAHVMGREENEVRLRFCVVTRRGMRNPLSYFPTLPTPGGLEYWSAGEVHVKSKDQCCPFTKGISSRDFGSGTSSEMNEKYERQVLVQWARQSSEEATWEWLTDFQSAYPTCNLEDKVVFEDGGNVTPLLVMADQPELAAGGFGGVDVAADVFEVTVWMWSGEVMVGWLLLVGVGGSSSWWFNDK
ncbi:retrotransposon-related protein [Tanacetum coccineum]